MEQLIQAPRTGDIKTFRSPTVTCGVCKKQSTIDVPYLWDNKMYRWGLETQSHHEQCRHCIAAYPETRIIPGTFYLSDLPRWMSTTSAERGRGESKEPEGKNLKKDGADKKEDGEGRVGFMKGPFGSTLMRH